MAAFALAASLVTTPQSAVALINFQDDVSHEIPSEGLVIDSDDTSTGDVYLQFGSALAETLRWDSVNLEFDLSDDLNVDGGIEVAGDIDFNQNAALELVLEQGVAFPVVPAPLEGQKFYRTDLNQEFVFNGTDWVSTSESDNDRTLVFEPEYSGAVVYPDGTTNDGVLELGWDAANVENFYEWRVKKAGLQDIDVILSIPLPEDFASFQAIPLQFEYRTSDPDNTDAQIDVTVLDSVGATVSLTGASDLNSTSWATADVTFSGSPTFTAGQFVTIRFNLQAQNDGGAQSAFLGTVYINYTKL